MENELLTVTDVAAALHLDRSTVHRRIVAGLITPDLTAGGRRLFTLDTVERLKRGEQHLSQDVAR